MASLSSDNSSAVVAYLQSAGCRSRFATIGHLLGERTGGTTNNSVGSSGIFAALIAEKIQSH